MKTPQGGGFEFEAALYRIGEQDAARELYRARQVKRQERKQPQVWGYRGTGKRVRRDK